MLLTHSAPARSFATQNGSQTDYLPLSTSSSVRLSGASRRNTLAFTEPTSINEATTAQYSSLTPARVCELTEACVPPLDVTFVVEAPLR